MLSSCVFAASFVNTFVTAYASQSIRAQRIVIEEGKTSRVRYEEVLRDGTNEIVNVMAPMPFEWALVNGKTYVIENGQMNLSPVAIVDIEQRFMELLSSATSTTIISTQNVIYQGEPSIQINMITRNSTYVAVLSKKLLEIRFIKAEKPDDSISMIYTEISPITPEYFQKVISSFEICNVATPSTVETVVWQLISNLKSANVMSMKINNITFTLVSGIMNSQNNVVCYIFDIKSKVSPDSLSDQFKAQGYSSVTVKYGDLYVVIASNGNIKELKTWTSHLFPNK